MATTAAATPTIQRPAEFAAPLAGAGTSAALAPGTPAAADDAHGSADGPSTTRMADDASTDGLTGLPDDATDDATADTDTDGTDVGGVRVSARSPQSVTVDGDGESLRAVVEELCSQAGIELRGYLAGDRPVRARYHDLGLRRALERLLRRENFTMGVRRRQGGPSQVAWLRVTGSRGGMAPAPATTAAGAATVTLPHTAMSAERESVRLAAARNFARKLDRDEKFRQRFLAAPSYQLVQQMRQYEYADAFLVELQAQLTERDLRWKVAGMRAQLGRQR